MHFIHMSAKELNIWKKKMSVFRFRVVLKGTYGVKQQIDLKMQDLSLNTSYILIEVSLTFFF